jgi:hypothetical protein
MTEYSPEPEINPVPENDLGADIVAEIDRVLAVPFQSQASPLLLEILSHLQINQLALKHRTDALLRIKRTLAAAAEPRDSSVTAP